MERSQHKENTKAWWDERYERADGFLYSKTPSSFVFDYIDLIPSAGKVLEVASGEGRNAVALALKGFQVTAIDFSAVAQARAQKLAADSGASVTWKNSDLDFFLPELLSFDAIVCVDFKVPITLLKNLSRGLKSSGHLFMEAPLLESMKTNKSLEAFECYKPNEILTSLNPQTMSFQVQFYSELGPAKWGDKAFLIAKKTQLF